MKTLDITTLMTPDQLGCWISDRYVTWENLRQDNLKIWKEAQEYVFATDTTHTANAKLPWSNKTTIPKLCQIRENLHANYMAAMFPKNKWLTWKGESENDDSAQKIEAIEGFMTWVTSRNEYYDTMSRLVLDYIDYGNAFATIDWVDRRITTEDSDKVGFVGPLPRRISPLDIVFDPTTPHFIDTPKIVRSLISMGEAKLMIDRMSGTPEDKAEAEEVFKYMKNLRAQVREHQGSGNRTLDVKDRNYFIAGFSNFRDYLLSNHVEVLTFYGDIYDENTDTLKRNHVIKVVDRHKVIYDQPNTSVFGTGPIYHVGWRLRPDNLWAQGPLENLLGMQYRIDHLENMKADCFDLIAYPPVIVKGYVEQFKWAPMEKIYVGDDGDVIIRSPDVNVLQADTQIAILEAKMEEMAGSPKEAMGFRTPGEKTKYEVQSLENAASRIFQAKTRYFESQFTENILNGMLETGRRLLQGPAVVSVFDSQDKIQVFSTLTAEDLAGVGRIVPVAARHFAEQSMMVQNLTNFFGSSSGQDPSVSQHFSGVRLAQLWEQLLEIEDYNLVSPYVRLAEQADAQRKANVHTEQVGTEAMMDDGLSNADQEALFAMDQAPQGGGGGGEVL